MKKIFYQLHPWFLLSIIFYLTFIGLGVFCLVYGIINISHFYLILIGLIPIFIFGYSLICIMYYRIIFLDDKIIVTGELGKNCTQYKEEIIYNDIKNISVIYANKNSKKEPLSASLNNLRPRLYFEFQLKNDETKWVYISWFSKKQKNKMLEIINKKTGLSFNYQSLNKTDLSDYNKNRK